MKHDGIQKGGEEMEGPSSSIGASDRQAGSSRWCHLIDDCLESWQVEHALEEGHTPANMQARQLKALAFGNVKQWHVSRECSV
jgi:hypothetical protein